MITEAKSIAGALKNKETITTLILKGSRLEELPEEIKELKKLEVLLIQNNRLTSLPDWLGEMEHLRNIQAYSNAIQQIGKLPPNLQNIALQNNQLLELPNHICELKQLQYISLANNQLSELPEGFEKIFDNGLTSVHLQKNKFTVFPKFICNYPKLTVINFSENKLTQLPKEIGLLTNLFRVNFSYNKLTSIPQNIKYWKNIHVIDFSHNKIKELPQEIGHCQELSTLHFNYNLLSKLPKDIELLSQLHELGISNNQLSTFDFDLGKLTQLRDLYLSKNQFTELPDIFDQLIHLNNINISDNPLAQLPSSLLTKSDFRMLYASRLAFKHLPLELLFISNLKYLYAEDNGLDKIIIEKRKAFAHACKLKNLSIEETKVFYDLTIQSTSDYPLETYFEALSFNFIETQQNALAYIYDDGNKKLKTNPIKKGITVTVLGKTNFKKTELKTRLKELGVNYSPKITAKTTHVVLERGAKNYEGFDQENLIFIPEKAIQDFLIANETLYLAEEDTSKEEKENVNALLLSSDNDMVNVGLEMMNTLGVPDDCMEALFIICNHSKRYDDKTRKLAKKLILLYGDEQLKTNIQKYKSAILVSNRPFNAFNFSRDLNLLTENTQLDIITIIEYLHIHYQVYFWALVNALKGDEKKVELFTRLLKHNPYQEIVDTQFADPQKAFALPAKNVKLHNRYEELPSELFEMTQLEELNVESRTLTELPEDLKKLTNLKKLDISGNKIPYFPDVLNDMPHLKEIVIAGNPFAKKKRQIPSEEIFDLSEHPKKITRK